MHIHHVLMHLLALGAFSPTLLRPSPSLALMVLMHRLALGAFSLVERGYEFVGYLES